MSAAQQWTCRVCTFDNSSTQSAACSVCNSPNHLLVWECSTCSFHNSDQNLEACDVCNSPRRPAVQPPVSGGAGFGLSGIVDPVQPQETECDFFSFVRRTCEAKATNRRDASRQLPAALTPVALPLLAVLQQLHRARAFLRRCSAAGVSLTSVLLPPPEHRLRLLKSLPLYTATANLRDQDGLDDDSDLHFELVPDAILGHRQRLRTACDAFTGKLVLLLTQGNRRDIPLLQRNCGRAMDSILRRLAVGRVSVMLQELEARAQFHRSKGQCMAAARILRYAIALGSLPSRAHLADMLLDGREGFREDRKMAFELVDRGAELGCHHCQGVLSRCYSLTDGSFGPSLPSKCHKAAHNREAVARQSAAKGSMWAHFKCN